jgi:PAS domain S-box-containing protein
MTDSPTLWALLVRTSQFDQDPGFRDRLRRATHQGLKWAGLVALAGELFYVALSLFVLDKSAVLVPPAQMDGASVLLIDDLFNAGVAVLCLVFAWWGCSLRAGRRFMAGALLAAVAVTLSDDLLYGDLQDPGYLAVIYMLAVVAVPFRPWQVLGLGAGIIGLLLGLSPLGLLPPGTGPVVGQLPLLVVVTALMTGITVILYLNRWSEHRARERTQAALDEHRLLLRTTQEVGNIGGWQFDLESSSLSWTRQVYRIYDLSPDAEPDLNALLSPYPSEARTSLRTALVRCMETGEPFEVELPFEGADEPRWVQIRGHAVEPEGQSSQIVGTIQDVTDRRQMEEDLRENEAWLRSITQNITDGLYRSTPNQGLLYTNAAFATMFGYDDPQSLLDIDPSTLYADPTQRDALMAQLDEQGRLDRVEVEFRRRDGTTFVGLLSSSVVTDEDDEIQYYDGAITDITERKAREEQLLRRQSKIEALYAATRHLLEADDREDVAREIEALVTDTLDYPLNTIRFEEDGRLVPVHSSAATADHMPERSVYDTADDRPAAQAFRSGDTLRFSDVQATDASLNVGEARATAYVPIDGHGVISVSTLSPGAIDDFDLRVLEILASNAAAVLDRVAHIQQLTRAVE